MSNHPVALPAPTIDAWLKPPLDRFQSFSLQELTDVDLPNRIDTKFLLTREQARLLLEALAGDYDVLEVMDLRIHHYVTLYFDTPSFDFYRAHHSGRPHRYKVRSRRYEREGTNVLEVKHKDPRGRTTKYRFPTETFVTKLDGSDLNRVNACLPIARAELEPKIWNSFSRITLGSRRDEEKVTLDLDLSAWVPERSVHFPGVVVAELKQLSRNSDSRFLQSVRHLGIHSTSLSKYCISAALLCGGLKHNRFGGVLRKVRRITQDHLA